MYCTIPLKNRNCILQSINCTLQQQQGVGGSFRYCTSSLYHLNLSPFYQTPLQAVCRYKVTYGVIKCMFSASIELALLRGLDKFSQLSKGSFNPSGVLLTQFAWIAPAWGTGSDCTMFHWQDKISYQVLCAWQVVKLIQVVNASESSMKLRRNEYRQQLKVKVAQDR